MAFLHLVNDCCSIIIFPTWTLSTKATIRFDKEQPSFFKCLEGNHCFD
jgi:hypothetical protein